MAGEIRQRGTMLWYSLDRDEGVLEQEHGDRLPINGGAFADGHRPQPRCGGTPITFRHVDGQATDVTFVAEAERGRARSHRGGYR